MLRTRESFEFCRDGVLMGLLENYEVDLDFRGERGGLSYEAFVGIVKAIEGVLAERGIKQPVVSTGDSDGSREQATTGREAIR